MSNDFDRLLKGIVGAVQERDAAAQRGDAAKSAAERKAADDKAIALDSWTRCREALRLACLSTNEAVKDIDVSVQLIDIDDSEYLAAVRLAVYRFGQWTDLETVVSVDLAGNQWVSADSFPSDRELTLPNMMQCGGYQYQEFLIHLLEAVIDLLPNR